MVKLTHLGGMEKALIIIFCLFFLNFTEAQNATESGAGTFNVGVILDLETMVGKMAYTSISMALEDFYAVHRNYSTKLSLHTRDSHGDDIQAAAAGYITQLVILVILK